jgi:hypothetical protein
MWSRAGQVFVAWDGRSSDKTTRGTLAGMKISPINFDFWSYDDIALRVDPAIKADVDDITGDVQQNRMPIANLCRTLGDSILTTDGLLAAMSNMPTAPRTIAAYMIVYASWRLAACVAQKQNREKDEYGHTKVYTYDLYAATVWACFVLCKAQRAVLDGDPDWSFDDVMTVLTLELRGNTILSSPNEGLGIASAWSKTEVFGDLGYFIALGRSKLAVLPGEKTTNATFAFTTVTQAANAEAIFYAMAALTYAVLLKTRVAYVPLFMGEVSRDVDAYNAFRDIWKATGDTTMDVLFELESKYTSLVCGEDDELDCTMRVRRGEDVYWDPVSKKCRSSIPITPIPAPSPEEECKKRQDAGEDVYWDPVSNSCLSRIPITPVLTPEQECNKRKDAGEDVFWDGSNCIKRVKPIPSGGGGGGGGGGGSGPALFIGILALLALFGRR